MNKYIFLCPVLIISVFSVYCEADEFSVSKYSNCEKCKDKENANKLEEGIKCRNDIIGQTLANGFQQIVEKTKSDPDNCNKEIMEFYNKEISNTQKDEIAKKCFALLFSIDVKKC